MNTKPSDLTVAKEAFTDLQAQADKIKLEVTELEAETSSLDYTKPGSMDRLAGIESSLSARRRALAAFRGKLAEAQAAITTAERKELQAQSLELIAERDALTKTTIKKLRELRASLDKLEVVKFRLQSEFKVGSPDIFTKDLTQAVNYVFTQRAGFFPKEFDLPARPSAREAAVTDAERYLKETKARLADFKRKQGKISGGTHHEDIDRAQEDVDRAEVRLRRARGEVVDVVAEARAEAATERHAILAEEAAGQASWQARARELGARLAGDKNSGGKK
jgi:hypothetical protein